MHEKALPQRLIGFVLSLILTLVAFFIIINPEWFHLTKPMAINVILGLAFTQATVQVFFFLDLCQEKGPMWNLNTFLATLSIIFVIIGFSIWIMGDLGHRM